MRFPVLAVAFFCAACSRQPASRQLTVAAAADLNFAMGDISRAFREAHPGIEVHVAYGSSGNFYSQIRTARPSIFSSPPISIMPAAWPPKARARPARFSPMASAAWSCGCPRRPRSIPPRRCASGAMRHLAIANPAHAPYGRAAEAALRSPPLRRCPDQTRARRKHRANLPIRPKAVRPTLESSRSRWRWRRPRAAGAAIGRSRSTPTRGWSRAASS